MTRRRRSTRLEVVRAEVAAAGIEKRAIVAVTKLDEAGCRRAVRRTRLRRSTGLPAVVPVSVLDDESLDRLRVAIWALTGLIRVLRRRGGHVDDEPFALAEGATVAELADLIHHDVGRRPPADGCGARRRGSTASASGRAHVLADGDVVEVTTR